jgi:hypothetical protein
VALAVFVAACGGDGQVPDSTIAPGRGADNAVGAVEELVEAINTPDFANASRLAIPGQAALAALAEGATFGEVARALDEGDEEIAANFWTGFAQETGSFLTGDVSISDGGVVSEGDVEFTKVTVTPAGGNPRTIVVRDVDGYRVDLFASFGAGLADKMTGPVERLLSANTADSSLILSELRGIVPSLTLATSLAGGTPESAQQLIALIEVITRVG